MIQRVKELYSIIANRQLGDDPESVCARVDIVRELEKLIGQNFRNTEDFHRKINSFLLQKQAIKNEVERFIQARQKAGMTQKQLAEFLGVSIRRIKHWEAGTKPISKKALIWLNSIAQNSASECEKSQKVTLSSVPRPNGEGA